MKTLSPKQLEIANRSTRILQVARPMVLEHGYHGLNMDRIASELGLSKGTIYNHFSCKEEIVIALAVETIQKRVELLELAAHFNDRPRFRMLAVAEATERFVTRCPEHFRFEEIIRLDSVWAKTSEQRRAIIGQCELKCVGIVADIVRDAIALGDLVLLPEMTPEDLVFGLWALTSGAYTIVLTSESLGKLGLADPLGSIRRHISIMLDAHRWKPLSSEFDHDEVTSMISRAVFGTA